MKFLLLKSNFDYFAWRLAQRRACCELQKITMTKQQFKSRVRALGLDPVQAAVLFGFSHPARIYSESESVSIARASLLAVFVHEKADGRLEQRLKANEKAITAMREKQKNALRQWRKKSARKSAAK